MPIMCCKKNGTVYRIPKDQNFSDPWVMCSVVAGGANPEAAIENVNKIADGVEAKDSRYIDDLQQKTDIVLKNLKKQTSYIF